jgi:hypothetical protein
MRAAIENPVISQCSTMKPLALTRRDPPVLTRMDPAKERGGDISFPRRVFSSEEGDWRSVAGKGC